MIKITKTDLAEHIYVPWALYVWYMVYPSQEHPRIRWSNYYSQFYLPKTLTKSGLLSCKAQFYAAYLTPKGISLNQIKLNSFSLVDHQCITCSMQHTLNLLFQQYTAQKLLDQYKEQKVWVFVSSILQLSTIYTQQYVRLSWWSSKL